jgi:4-hydroxythreonine-4-phosphate dehydrogenase
MHKLLITLGDPAGIGPEVIVKCLAKLAHSEDIEPVVVGERDLLE